MEPLNEVRRASHNSSSITKTVSSPLTEPHRSFAERKAQTSGPTPLRVVEGSNNMRDIERPPPGDVVSRKKRSQSKPELTKQRSNYFEDAFAVKEVNPARDRILSESIVMADLKTNLKIDDEFTFITELSYILSVRYQRPLSSIVVTLHHHTCLIFGGTFEAAYVLSVHALSTQLQPTTNKRNAALIQKHLEDVLGIKPSRGLIRFVPTPEDNTARNGKTLAGEIEEGKLTAGEAAQEFSGLPRVRSKPTNRLSARSFGTLRSSPAVLEQVGEPTPSAEEGEPEGRTSFAADLPAPPVRIAKRTKSFVASLFGRS